MRENVFALRSQGLSGGYWTSGRRMAIGRFRRSKPAYGWISRLAPKSVHETFTNRGNFFRGGGPISRRCKASLLGLMAGLRGSGGAELGFAKADAAIRIQLLGGEFMGDVASAGGETTAAPQPCGA